MIAPKFPGQLPLPNVHSINLCRAPLEKAIGETTRGRPKIDRRPAADVDPEFRKSVLQLLPAPADILLPSHHGDTVLIAHHITGLMRGMVVYPHLPGHNRAFGLLAALEDAAFHERDVEALHGGADELASSPAGSRRGLRSCNGNQTRKVVPWPTRLCSS